MLGEPAETKMPDARRVVASCDHALLALLFSDRVIVATLPALEAIAEIALDPSVATHDIGFGAHPRRLVLMSGTSVYLIDVDGPEIVTQCTLAAVGSIAAIIGDHVLVLARGVASVIDLTKTELRANRLSTRGAVTAAGVFDDAHVVACVGGVLEVWNLRAAAPVRRIRMDRQVTAAHLGGNERRIWMVTQGEPDRVMIVPLQSNRPPHSIVLPAAISRAVADDSGNLLAIVTQDGNAVVVDLGDGDLTPLAHPSIRDLAWLRDGFAACASAQSIDILRIAAAPPSASESPTSTAEPVLAASDDRPPDDSPTEPADAAREPSTWERLNSWRDRVSKTRTPPVLRTPRATAPSREEPAMAAGWREGVGSWARRTIAGATGEAPPDLGLIDELAIRLHLDIDQARAVALVYGARLSGTTEVAPLDLARAAGWRWPEALGSGRLAELGILRWRAGQARLAEVVAAILDERPVLEGELVGASPSLVERGAVIAPPTVALADVAAWATAFAGSLLVPRDGADPRDFLLEAHARGVTPLIGDAWRSRYGLGQGLFVVARADEARELGLDIAGSWPVPRDVATTSSKSVS